ncbi:MAG TPA: hypothetical protein VKR61_04640 [Bryobacteraceae bacterium]|nr:hypothetical protein [Bryobacteraceae bacterium]
MFSPVRLAQFGVLLCCALSSGFAAAPAIGMAIADGSFQLDRSHVRGTATLFDGNLIETGPSASQLRLHNGVRLRLAADSRARVYESRLILEKGIGQLDSASYHIEAGGLQVALGKPGATARVQVTDPRRVVVAAPAGPVRVSNRDGVLIARLESGHEMTFEPQDAVTTVTKVSGILALKDGQFIVVDRVTNVTMQLVGAGLENEVGNLVEITGTVDSAPPTVAGASQLIDVTKVTLLVKGAAVAGTGGAGAAGAGAAGAGAAAAAGTGLSTGALVAIIGGVAAAGTIGGLAAAHALPGQGSNQTSTSR